MAWRLETKTNLSVKRNKTTFATMHGLLSSSNIIKGPNIFRKEFGVIAFKKKSSLNCIIIWYGRRGEKWVVPTYEVAQ